MFLCIIDLFTEVGEAFVRRISMFLPVFLLLRVMIFRFLRCSHVREKDDAGGNLEDLSERFQRKIDEISITKYELVDC